MDLTLESHVFHMLENQGHLLGEIEEFNWGLDMDTGLLTFTSAGSGRILSQHRVQIIGTVSSRSNTWRWAWANVESDIPANLLRGIETVRAAAAETGKSLFSDPQDIPVPRDRFGAELAIISAGAMGAFTYYAGGHSDGVIYTAVEGPPNGFQSRTPVRTKQQTIQMGISTLSFEHRPAVLAYLGSPSAVEGELLTWNLGDEWLRIRFDAEGRIADMEAKITRTAQTAPTAEKKPRWRFW